MAEYNDDGFEVDENGVVKTDDAGNEILKPEKEKEDPPVEDPPKEEEIEDLKRQISGLNMNAANDRIEKKELESQLTALREEPKKLDPDEELETITKADLRKALAAERLAAKKEAVNERDINDLEDARADKDFAKIEQMAKEVMDKDPDMNAAYKNARNLPAFYRKIAKLHPDYEADIKTAARTDTVKKINKAGTKVSTGAGVGGKAPGKSKNESHDDLTIEDMNKMSDAEIAALPDSVQKRLLEGEEE